MLRRLPGWNAIYYQTMKELIHNYLEANDLLLAALRSSNNCRGLNDHENILLQFGHTLCIPLPMKKIDKNDVK